HTVARVDFPLAGKGQDQAAIRALETLRGTVIPPVLATLPPGTQAAVTGDTAGTHDFNQTTKSHAPLVFGFVLGLAFLLLLLTFRSIVIPVKAIILNLLSVGAAYGILVWIFQDGHLQGLLGFHSNGAVATIIRGVLLPATMKLLGDWNWYLPRWLEWLPRLNVEAELERTPAAPVPAPQPAYAIAGTADGSAGVLHAPEP